MRRAGRFIFVEGLPGAGKTTTGEWLAERLGWRFVAEGPTHKEPLHPLRVNSKLAHPLAVWRDVSVEEYVALSLRLWREFVATAQDSVVCDGLLFHGNMADLLLMDAPAGLMRGYVAGILETIEPLGPAVIYLRRPDVAAALRTIGDTRGEGWQCYQIDWKMDSPYARRRGLTGLEGLIRLYEEYVAICDEVVDGLTAPTLVVDLDGDWPRARRDMLSFLA